MAGRKPKHHIDARGNQIKGLARDAKSGRWRIIGTTTFFTETDEAEAIRRYYRIVGQNQIVEGEVAGSILRTTANEIRSFKDELDAIIARNEQQFWSYVAQQIIDEPKRIAKLTSIERLGYLTDLTPPKPAPTFDELTKLWETHFRKSTEQRRKVLHAWRDFVATAKVAELREITPEVVLSYRDQVHRRGWTPKMQSNVFTRIRRLLTFARKDRLIDHDALVSAIERLKSLTPDGTTVSLDPQPISRADFTKLLDHAGAEDRAMLLLMLNGAYYIGEVVRTKWSDVKGDCVVTNRRKEGNVIRVCVLWPETRKAIDALPRHGDYLFYSRVGAPLGVKGAEKRFRELRTLAKVGANVTSSHLRDGVATAAAMAGADPAMMNVILGHRSGINDHYIRRNPTMVKAVSDAVRKAYLT